MLPRYQWAFLPKLCLQLSASMRLHTGPSRFRVNKKPRCYPRPGLQPLAVELCSLPLCTIAHERLAIARCVRCTAPGARGGGSRSDVSCDGRGEKILFRAIDV